MLQPKPQSTLKFYVKHNHLIPITLQIIEKYHTEGLPVVLPHQSNVPFITYYLTILNIYLYKISIDIFRNW